MTYSNISATKGFTFIELMVTLAIAAILAGIATPSLKHLFQQQNAQAKSSKLFTLLQYSRSLAINSNTYVTLCPSNDKINCTDNWQDPLIIFLDKDKNEKIENPNQIRKIKQVINTERETLVLKAAAGRQYVQFNRHGFVNSTNGRLNFCQKENEDDIYNRTLVISLTGRVRVEHPKDAKKPIKC